MKSFFLILALINITLTHQDRWGPSNEDNLVVAMNYYNDKTSRSNSWGYGPYGSELQDMAAVDDLFYKGYTSGGYGGYGGYGGNHNAGSYARYGGYNRRNNRGFYSNLTYGSGWAFGNGGLRNHGTNFYGPQYNYGGYGGYGYQEY